VPPSFEKREGAFIPDPETSHKTLKNPWIHCKTSANYFGASSRSTIIGNII